MLEQVNEFIQKYHMLSQGDGVIVGLSGGADSVCLLTVLCELREIYDLKIAAVHVNHMIRGTEADADQQYAETLCRSCHVPCVVYKENIPELAADWGMTEEEAGRTFRYQCFREELNKRGFTKIAVAHNKDDLAETVIFNLIRGSGLNGLGGIRPVRDNIIRPLLDTKRTDIERYLNEKKIQFQTDATNHSLDYDRNRIRHKILPVMKEINRNAVDHICNMAYDTASLYEDIRHEAESVNIEYVSDNAVTLDRRKLRECSKTLQGEVILRAMEKLSGKRKDITRRHILSVQGLLENDTGKSVMLPYGLTARNSYDRLYIEREKESHNFCIEIEKSGNYQIEPGVLTAEICKRQDAGPISKKEYTKMVDYGNIRGNLSFRTPQEGDYIIVNAAGGRKKLSRLFTDRKIDRRKREGWPVIACGSEIIWAVGLRLSEAYKITDETKEVIILTFNRKEDTDGREN